MVASQNKPVPIPIPPAVEGAPEPNPSVPAASIQPAVPGPRPISLENLSHSSPTKEFNTLMGNPDMKLYHGRDLDGKLEMIRERLPVHIETCMISTLIMTTEGARIQQLKRDRQVKCHRLTHISPLIPSSFCRLTPKRHISRYFRRLLLTASSSGAPRLPETAMAESWSVADSPSD